MAAVSTLPQPRRKKPATYGKSSRNVNAWNLSSLDDEELPSPKRSIEKSPTVKQSYPIQKTEPKPHALASIKRHEKKQDAFDVPSSDEEEPTPIKRKSPSKLVSGKRQVVSVVKESEEPLASWEKSKTQESQSEQEARSRRKKHVPTSSDAPLTEDLARALRKDETVNRLGGTPKATKQSKPGQTAVVSPAKGLSPGTSSAAARLQARKPLNGAQAIVSSDEASTTTQRAQKRTGPDVDKSNPTPRKKLRAETPAVEKSSDIAMNDAPACDSPSLQAMDASEAMDVYDLPDSSADESPKPRPVAVNRKSPQKNRRGKLTTYARSSPRKMESAPARLSEMLATDTDTTDATTRSPSVANSRPSTPQKSPNSSRVVTPETAFKRTGAMTPKQSQLWDQLLASDVPVASPNRLPIEDLTLNTRRTVKTTVAPPRSLAKPSSDVGPRRRMKLVDRLKASAPSTDNESSEESEEEEDEDVEMGDGDDTPEPEGELSQQSQSQSQSQSTVVGGSGPKVTYAGRTRSHLPEDFEDGLMFSLTSETPQRTGGASRHASNKSNATSQKSAFDIDESDDETQTSRMRTIHELRAGGVNQRFMDDIGGLLEDIADHNVSARSRRRSALMEIANKLADSAFAEKFLRQGYEHQLLNECAAAEDDIADFALAAAFAAMVTKELPHHAAQSLKEGGILSWLSRLLDTRNDAMKLAKDRQNNMSKSAQKSFADFVGVLAGQESIWGETRPTSITPRRVALKVCDKLVQCLRRSGDRSELLGANDIRRVAPSEDEGNAISEDDVPIDLTLSVSILESLSTTALSLNWSSGIVEGLRTILVHPRLGEGKSQHLYFLTLRLCLNLTNDNARNCKTLAKPPTVIRLLRAMNEGFDKLYAEVGEEQRTINLDLLVLSMGILINLTEHNASACEQAASSSEASSLLTCLVAVFQAGQQRLIEADTVEESVTNVAYGYLAVVLANICRNPSAKALIASQLPGNKLTALVAALAEFVVHHQKVDTITLEVQEGMEVWSAFTEKLRGVLKKLKAEADEMEEL